jgi:hypothetical protein
MVRTPARRNWPSGLLGMLALVLAAEHFVARHDLDFARPENWNWRLSGRAAGSSRAASGCEIACFGSSVMHMGIVPQVIEKITGAKGYNFGVCIGTAPVHYYLFRRLLDSGIRPRAVVVEYHPHLLTVGPDFAARFWPELAGLGDALDLARTTRDPILFARLATAMALPSVRERDEVRAQVVAALRGQPATPRELNLAFRRNYRRNHGAHLDPRNPAFRGAITPGTAQTLLDDTWACLPINRQYIRRLLALAADRQIPVYWLMPPLCVTLQDQRERQGLDRLYTGFARSIQAEFPGLVVIDGRHSNYVDAVFKDEVHLDRQGATTLSVQVGEALAEHLADRRHARRWIDLPAYRDRPIDVPTEDLVESVLALRKQTGDRR